MKVNFGHCFKGFKVVNLFHKFFYQISQEISSEGQISADEELSVEDLMKKLKSI